METEIGDLRPQLMRFGSGTILHKPLGYSRNSLELAPRVVDLHLGVGDPGVDQLASQCVRRAMFGTR
jgi:hypothetical protein